MSFANYPAKFLASFFVGKIIKRFHRNPSFVFYFLEDIGYFSEIGISLSRAPQVGVIGMEMNAVLMKLADRRTDSIWLGRHCFDIKVQSTSRMVDCLYKITALGTIGEKVGSTLASGSIAKATPRSSICWQTAFISFTARSKACS